MKKMMAPLLMLLSLSTNSAFASFEGKVTFSYLSDLVRPFKGQLTMISEMNVFHITNITNITNITLPNDNRYAIVDDESSTSPYSLSTDISAVSVANAICDFTTIKIIPSNDQRSGGSMDFYCIIR